MDGEWHWYVQVNILFKKVKLYSIGDLTFLIFSHGTTENMLHLQKYAWPLGNSFVAKLQ